MNNGYTTKGGQLMIYLRNHEVFGANNTLEPLKQLFFVHHFSRRITPVFQK